MTKLLIDSDILLYQSAFAVEKEVRWDDDIITLHTDANELISALDRSLETIQANLGGDIILAMTHSRNFRKTLYPAYKANRTSRKPLGFHTGREYLAATYQTYERPWLEADDCLGILAGLHGSDCIVVSADKDLLQIPGLHASMEGATVTRVTPEDGEAMFWKQALTGDATDNYPGCPGIGPVKAWSILKDLKTTEERWAAVVATYRKHGLSEEYALTQARLAKILTPDLYNFETKEAILWNP